MSSRCRSGLWQPHLWNVNKGGLPSLQGSSDGSIGTITVVTAHGPAWLELAAKRALVNASPFAPHPQAFGGDDLTIRAVFREER